MFIKNYEKLYWNNVQRICWTLKLLYFHNILQIMNEMEKGIGFRKGWVEIFDYKLTPTCIVFLISLEHKLKRLNILSYIQNV